MCREGFGIRVCFGEGGTPQRCSAVWWESAGDGINAQDVFKGKKVILFKTNNKQHTEHGKLLQQLLCTREKQHRGRE